MMTSNSNWALQLLTLMGIGGPLMVGACATPAAADIFTGTDSGASSDVKAFDAAGGVNKDFLAYPGFIGGVRVAAGDVNGDGLSDIITGAGAAGNGHVKVFDG